MLRRLGTPVNGNDKSSLGVSDVENNLHMACPILDWSLGSNCCRHSRGGWSRSLHEQHHVYTVLPISSKFVCQRAPVDDQLNSNQSYKCAPELCRSEPTSSWLIIALSFTVLLLFPDPLTNYSKTTQRRSVTTRSRMCSRCKISHFPIPNSSARSKHL